ncbi:MAG: RNA polymerase sigma factor, partial [Acidimicrobiia bacterium]
MPERGPERETEGLEADRFEVLVRELAPSLYRFALSIVRDPHAAEDLVQETFVRGFEQRTRFRRDSSEATWLRRILHNLAVDRARRSSHEVLVDEVEEKWRDDAYTVDAAVVVEHAETREDLEDGLVRLPFIYRSAVVLHDVEGWTMREVAETM